MTEEEINEYNYLCAKFLTWSYNRENDFNKFRDSKSKNIKSISDMKIYLNWKWIHEVCEDVKYISDMDFYSDWNWIHEIIDAIEKDKYLLDKERPYQLIINGNYCEICFCRWNDKGKDFYGTKQIIVTKKDSKKESVVHAIYSFLKFYYDNKK